MYARFSLQWIVLSAILLAVYLTFFHVCLLCNDLQCQMAGILFWSAWAGICFHNRERFANTFEYLIHQFVGLDILLEGFNPFHDGYGFYFCALAFWAVLVIYHLFATRNVDMECQASA